MSTDITISESEISQAYRPVAKRKTKAKAKVVKKDTKKKAKAKSKPKKKAKARVKNANIDNLKIGGQSELPM